MEIVFGEDAPEYSIEDSGFGVAGRKQVVVGASRGERGGPLVRRDSTNPTAL